MIFSVNPPLSEKAQTAIRERAESEARWRGVIAEAQTVAESIPTARDPWSYAR